MAFACVIKVGILVTSSLNELKDGTIPWKVRSPSKTGTFKDRPVQEQKHNIMTPLPWEGARFSGKRERYKADCAYGHCLLCLFPSLLLP